MDSGINVVAVCPNENVRNALIRTIRETGGIRPAQHSSSESADRAHYAPAQCKVIINTASAHMRDLLGLHSVALAIETADRVAAAERAKEIFAAAGFEATVHTHAEPEFPDGFIVFVAVPDLQGIVLMFWPRPEDITDDVKATLPERRPWDNSVA